MKPKRILSNGILHILLDSESLLQSYADNPKSLNFLHYRHEKYFNMKRTPTMTGVPDIDEIPTFENLIDAAANSGSIKYKEGNSSICAGITDNLAIIGEICKSVFNEPEATADNWKKIWNIFVHVYMSHKDDFNISRHPSFNHKANSSIYITTDDAILKNRGYFAKHSIDNLPVHIFSIEEGKEVMDIFAKNLGTYFLAPKYHARPNYYYDVALSSSLPHYHPPTMTDLRDGAGNPRKMVPPLSAINNRFVYLLKCIDEMGINYYRGLDNDVSDNIQFYFNYFMILVTGIFDSLARDTKTRYDLKFKGDDIPGRISLSESAGSCFLKALKAVKQDLYDHIMANAAFRSLVYCFRELIIHREFKSPTTFNTLNGMEDSLIQIEKEVAGCLIRLGDKKSRYNEHSEWGYSKNELGEYISPYIFSKRATLNLINFVDGYLEKSGLSDYVEKISESGLGEHIQRFREVGLSCRLPENTKLSHAS